MSRTKLTNTKVKALEAPADKDQAFYWDSEMPGFAVRVTAMGAKSYIVQGRVNGKTRRFTIGPYELISCEDARRRAQARLLEMYDGVDPQVQKRQKVARSETLREVMEDYLEYKRTKNGALRPSSKADIRRCVEVTFSDWANAPVVNISRDACIKRFRDLSKRAPVQTNQAFRNLRALLNWAREKNATTEGVYPVLPINPVSQMFKKGGLVQWNKETARVTRIPHDRVGQVWLLLERYSNPDLSITTTRTSADLIAFMLLTGTRISEASKLTWDKVSLEGKVPCFHLAETKNHNPVTLPINSVLKTILSRRYDTRSDSSEFVFPAQRGRKGYLSDPRAVFIRISEEAGTHLHPHALRRTFEDIAQCVGVNSDQRRQLLNHLASDVHGASYANNPDPAVLLPAVEKIGAWVIQQGRLAAEAASGENVVLLRA